MSEIADAARRVADDIRQGNRPLPDDMLALLPVLDAVAAGQDDDGRTLKPCPFCGCPAELCTTADASPDRVGDFVVVCQHCGAQGPTTWEDNYAESGWNARATIALADAERAAMAEAGWATYVKAAGGLHEDAWDDGRANRHESGTTIEARKDLNAAVRHLAGMTDGR